MRRLTLICAATALIAGGAIAQAPAPDPAQGQNSRDGRHDFDWEIGSWNTQLRLLRNPLSGAAPDWADYQGTSEVHPILDGRFNLVELSVAGAGGRIEGAALRLYDPRSRQWSLNYANVSSGTLTTPVYGSFDGHGRGSIYAHDTLDGRAILVRFIITVTSPREARFEQAYSADDGRSWETNWIAVDTRR